MLEYEFFDGEYFVTFDVIEINNANDKATMAISKAGKISVQEIDLQEDEDGLYFEYGPSCDIVRIEDFLIR